jgi:predicted NUDIX family NTP pyrophosphohydrolase
MSPKPAISSGLLLFRRTPRGLEVFLAHPGGPFWAGRDGGAWTIPKGAVETGEDVLDAAKREFVEETGITPTPPFLPLGFIKQKAWEGDADPRAITSNSTKTEWPRGSGEWVTYPEIDRCAWFDAATAKQKINSAQAELIDRLELMLAESRSGV